MRKSASKRADKRTAKPTAEYTCAADEFGSPRRGRYTAVDEGRPLTGRRFWLQPITLFIMSVLALIIVGTVQLWRMGALDAVFGPKSAQVDRSSKRWLLNGGAARTPDDRVAAEDAADPDRDPPPFEEVDAPPVTE